MNPGDVARRRPPGRLPRSTSCMRGILHARYLAWAVDGLLDGIALAARRLHAL